MKQNFLIILSFFISIYFVEFFLSIKKIDEIINSDQQNNLYCDISINCDKRNALQVYQDSIKKNDLILPNFTPVYRFQIKNYSDYKTNKGKKIFPLSKIANQKTAMCNENGEWIIYNTDHNGLNNAHKNYKDTDIFILGDSYVEGHCSNPENNIAGQLQTKTNYKVVNLGLAGSGPLMILASAKEYALKFKPKIIVWYHFHNDIINLQRYEKNSETLMKYLNNEKFNQNLIERQNEINEVAKKYLNNQIKKSNSFFTKEFNKMTFIKLWYVRTLIKKFGINTIGISEKMIQPNTVDFEIFEKILVQIKKITDEKNIELYFVFLPDITALYPNKYQHYEKVDSRYKVIKIAKKSFGTKTLDLTEILSKKFNEPKDLFTGGLIGNHYTDKGYNVVAEQTIKLINNSKKN